MRRCQMMMLALIILAVLILPPAQAQDQHILIYVNGVKITVAPIIRDGILYLPPMPLSEALAAKIEWVPKLNIIKVNDEVINAVPLNIDGRIYIPVESIAHAVGANVEWDGTKKTVRIYQGSASTAVKPMQPQTPPAPATLLPSPSTPVQPAVPPYNQTVAGSPPGGETGFVRPGNSPPTLPGGLNNGPPPISSEYPELAPPKTVSNDVFKVTVTGTELVQSIKDYYKPRHGYKFVVIYLSQQNVSKEVQIYTGKFSLLDQKGRVFDYIEGLSNFWLMILRPSGINFGYLIYELPEDSQPAHLVLQALNQKPLTLSL